MGDCDTGDPDVHPCGDEGSSADGIDQDCDLRTDEGTDGYDDDGDGYAESGGDCDDDDPEIHPGAAETCDHRDEDCDSLVDEDAEPQGEENWYDGVDDNCDGNDGDQDGDGYYLENYPWPIPEGFLPGDCDDDDPEIHPGATGYAPYDLDCDGIPDDLRGCGCASAQYPSPGSPSPRAPLALGLLLVLASAMRRLPPR